MTNRKCCLALAAFCLSLGATACGPRRSPIVRGLSLISVCEALDQVGALNGTEVRIRGLLGGSFLHGLGIFQNPVTVDPCPGWRARFLTAPSAIALYWNARDWPNGLPCAEAYRAGGFQRLHVVVQGVLVKRSRIPLIYRKSDGTYRSLYNTGYPPGAYLAALSVDSGGCRVDH